MTCGAFFELDRDTGTIGVFEVEGLEPGAGEYVDRMNAINPRMLYSLARPAPHVVTDYDILPPTTPAIIPGNWLPCV